MPNAYNTIKVNYNECPPDCRLCEEACAREKGRSASELSRIRAIHLSQMQFHGAMICAQCGEPRCLQICPAGAMEKNDEDGIVRIDEDRCVGCGLCTVACPYGGVHFDKETRKSFKCDHCDGDPKCVRACPKGSLSYIDNHAVLRALKEDPLAPGVSACRGCPSELYLRMALKILGKNTILFTTPSCACAWMHGVYPNASTKLPRLHCLFDNVAACMTGVSLYQKSIGKDVNCVSYCGDGSTVDIGFQALSGAAERNENIIYICYDNEGYMNTGDQRSSATPYLARTTTTPVGAARRGKEQGSKYVPLLMFFHGISYVATANIAYPEDYARKLTKAMQTKDGMSYLHLYSPCPTGWGTPEDRSIELCRLAVETHHFPLWEADHGTIKLNYASDHPKPMKEYVKRLGKYNHITAAEMDDLQTRVDNRYEMIKSLSQRDRPCRV
jgi:phenylglyoxylate dehydrogenase beta subunit